MIVTAVLEIGCGSEAVRLGTERESVIARLGRPDRQAILVGKVLQDIPNVSTGPIDSNHMVVYFYDSRGLRVWFTRGQVSGITKNGIAIKEIGK